MEDELVPLLNDSPTKETSKHSFSHFARWLAIAGPGMVVMLADTDAGCLITAGQSGAQWGYSLLPIQLVLIPIVYMAQELTIRLALFTKKGQVELIKRRYGNVWGWITALLIVLNCAGALICEFSAVVGIGELLGVPKWISAFLCFMCLTAVVATGSYQRVEKVCVAVGLFELVFLITMVMAAPSPEKFMSGLKVPIGDMDFLYLLSANIGAVVMPWMIFYQQSALISKGLTIEDLPYSRVDTAVGSCVTQLVMIAVVMTTAGTVWDGKLPGLSSLATVQDFSHALTPHLGLFAGSLLFCLGLLGGAMIGAVVVALTATWTVGEVAGLRHSLEDHPLDAPWFYGIYCFLLIFCAVISLSPINIVNLNVAIQVFNSLLLPVILYFLFKLASAQVDTPPPASDAPSALTTLPLPTPPASPDSSPRSPLSSCSSSSSSSAVSSRCNEEGRWDLPQEYLIKGSYKWCVGLCFVFCSIFGFIGGVGGLVSTSMAM